MRNIAFGLLIGLCAGCATFGNAASLLLDQFDRPDGSRVSTEIWHIPTRVAEGDGTFIGRTQLRVTQHAPLPRIEDGQAIISLETYNPTGEPPGRSIYGTDLISNESFSLQEGLHVKVRARMKAGTPPGMVGGIFLYGLRSKDGTDHDEIDFELITKKPGAIQTNIYSNEPLGQGHPGSTPYDNGSIYDYRTYEIRWEPNRVSWLVDGRLIRTEEDRIPTGPMYLHLNIWAPDHGWPEAYDDTLQHAGTPAENTEYWMSVDSVEITRPTGMDQPASSPVSPAIGLPRQGD